jgi:hypothetical protein
MSACTPLLHLGIMVRGHCVGCTFSLPLAASTSYVPKNLTLSDYLELKIISQQKITAVI